MSTEGNQAPERFLVRKNDEVDDASGHKANIAEDPDRTDDLGADRPDGDDEGAVEKHNYRR